MPLSRLNRLKRSRWPFQASLFFPKGLFGFESLTRFTLIGQEHEAPYLWLDSAENAAITFRVVDPFQFHPQYNPVISKKDLEDLEVKGEAELILFTIVNTADRHYRMNLEAPLLIHWERKLGKQLLFPLSSTIQ